MPRPTAKIAIDTDNERFVKLRRKLWKKAPNAVHFFDYINSYIEEHLPDLKRGTGDWYINYYYPKYGKKYVAFKIDSKQDGCSTECLNIAIYDEDYKNNLPKELTKHIYLKPSGFHNHGKFPYQASITSDSDLEWAYKLLDEIYRITRNQLI